METNATADYLVLADQSGSYYAIPAAELEKFAVSGERKAEIERLLSGDEDVSGYSFLIDEMMVSGIQADRRGAAAQARHANAAKSASTGEDRAPATEGKVTQIGRALLAGKFLVLSALKR